VVVLKLGIIQAKTRLARVTCLVELEMEAEEESRAASPAEPDLTAPERRQRKDLVKLPVDVAVKSESPSMTFCLLINAFANKLSLLTYCLNISII